MQILWVMHSYLCESFDLLFSNHSKTKTSWHLWAEHKKWAYVKLLICTNIKCYRPNSIYLLSRLYAILLSITKKTARKWKFGNVDDASCSAHKCQLVLVLLWSFVSITLFFESVCLFSWVHSNLWLELELFSSLPVFAVVFAVPPHVLFSHVVPFCSVNKVIFSAFTIACLELLTI